MICGFQEDARQAITCAPDYFVRWYTWKSVGLCVALVALAYYMGRGARA
jgi:hypothetical protein